jgi:hypothetical protein
MQIKITNSRLMLYETASLEAISKEILITILNLAINFKHITSNIQHYLSHKEGRRLSNVIHIYHTSGIVKGLLAS